MATGSVTSRITVRQGQPTEAAELTAIAWAAKRHWGYPDAWMTEWASVLTIAPEWIARNWVLVAEDRGEVLGFGALEIQAEQGWVQHLWVKPRCMRRGIGTMLFAEMEMHARTAGVTRLLVESDPNAEEFYRRMGAKPIGRVQADVSGTQRWLPLLAKELLCPCA
jgi:GNAT superfamily N-acetyltransferase